MKKNQNEELQSRREFFKKAAKGALPILGAIALANAPLLASAVESECNCTSCTASCSGGCSGCSGGCQGTCSSTCSGSCSGTCRGGCSGN